MKKLTILLIICTLSGCGLFKKTSKDTKKVELFGKTEQLNEVKKEVNEQTNEQSNKNTNEQIQEREKKDLNSETTLEADKITIDNKGNITAEGGAKLNNKLKDKGEKEMNANKAVQEDSSKQTNIVTNEEIKESVKKEIKQKSSDKHSISEPSGKGIIYGAVAILLIVLGLCFYFGFRPNK